MAWDPAGILDLCKRLDPAVLNSPKMTAEMIGSRPNTYTFTKALGESALAVEGGVLPIVIVRPSVVVAAWREPLPGWVENMNGPTGFIAGAGKGLLRTVYCKREKLIDLVPVDIPINLAIATAWRIASHPANAIPVYNCTSGASNPIQWGQVESLGMAAMRRYPMESVLWYPGGSFKQSNFVNKICQVAFQSLPAYIMDILSLLSGKKPVMIKTVQKMHKAQQATEFFAINEWKWSNDNTEQLKQELTEVDKKTFNFDLSGLSWEDYMVDYVKGTRQFVFKEDLSTLEQAREHAHKMFWIEKFLQLLVLVLLFKFLSWVIL